MAVIGISVGVGLVVYALSLRSGADEVLTLGNAPETVAPPRAERRRRSRRTLAPGFGSPPPRDTALAPPVATGEGPLYVPVLPASRTHWTTRVLGFVGLLVLVALAAAVLALTLYEVGHLVNQTIAKFLEQ
jgi:hypothetical protein